MWKDDHHPTMIFRRDYMILLNEYCMGMRKTMNADPSCIQKYLYIEKTPTWKVRGLYFFGLISWVLIVYGFLGVIGVDPFFTWFVAPCMALLTIYHFASFGIHLFYRQHDLQKHIALCQSFHEQPSIDIYLPICGENVSVLRNTWRHVKRLRYKNKQVYVLDDSKEGCDEHKQLAEEFEFHYFERPDKGRMKKAGNLKYAYERTAGDFIIIFDADFAPHRDFIVETLPYTQDPTVGIVQTPQYFELSPRSYAHSKVAYNAAFAEEPFYRFIQVTRSRFGGTICCGSNAVYRRSAFKAIGGPYQIEYSEDAHTGFAMTCAGYRVLFVPVLLAIGLCPENQYAFFHQQHRWAMGSMRLMLSKDFWRSKISWKTKFCYLTGFMFYMHHPLVILFSFQLFWTLFLYNEFVPVGNSSLYYPHLVFTIVYVWLFPIGRLRIGYFALLIGRAYAYSHAVKTALLKKTVGWVSTNAKHTVVSAAYRQTTAFVKVYFVLYALLIALGLRSGDIHMFDYRYWSVQFWMFWNFVLSAVLLWQLVKTAKEIEREKVNQSTT